MSNKKNYLVKHATDDVLGILPDVLGELGVQATVIDITQDNLPDPSDIDRLWVLGSIEAAYDHTVPWLEKELSWLKQVQEQDIPTFGICFGSQLLARAIGGQVYKNSQVEHGWIDMTVSDGDWQHTGPWFNYHFDAFSVPAKATLLAHSDLASQAYRYNRAWATQFHPEINKEMFDSWLDAWMKTPEGVAYYKSLGDLPDRLHAEIQERAESNYANCKALMEHYLNSIE